ncbi:MAG: hypothetical protein WBV82_30425 [Myxococcaceae bacterium]
MFDETRSRRTDRLRHLALSLERLLAEGIASGAVRGTADELHLEGLDDELRSMADDLLVLLRRLAEGAVAHPAFPPESWTERAAIGAVRGGVEELKRSLPLVNEAVGDILVRLGRWLDEASEEAKLRKEQDLAPGYRMRAASSGAVEGAIGQLEASLPILARFASTFASSAGRGFVEGATAAIGENLASGGVIRETGRSIASDVSRDIAHRVQAAAAAVRGKLRRPLAAAAGLGTVAVGALFLSLRRARMARRSRSRRLPETATPDSPSEDEKTYRRGAEYEPEEQWKKPRLRL